MAEYVKKLQIRSKDWNYGGPKWKLSRSKLDLFMECPLCFYLDNKLGVSRPRGPSFTLNIAVDELLKKEFDIHRAGKTAHPLMERYGVKAVPFAHKDLEDWRTNFTGIQYGDPNSGLTISGAIDDVWINPKEELIVVDYKATSKDGKIETLSDSGWDRQYKRQMEVYQWLLRRKGFKVSDTGYFVYVNGRKDKKAFDAKLEFDVTLIEHVGDDSWVEDAIMKAKKCLDAEKLPSPSSNCEHCMYRKFARDVQLKLKNDDNKSDRLL
ncbi:MAG TPA: PD-(D/E)XK nuclease family protein [Candidatus Paceibacterota bacterium]|nr:PD-(D/E)XK nuclease family protein [Candidatus Paceibacterota bacterium]